MDQAQAAILGAFVGGLAAIAAAYFTAAKQAKSEHNKWIREQTLSSYMLAIKSLSLASIIPIGTDLSEYKDWYQEISNVRMNLTNLSVFYKDTDTSFEKAINSLFRTIDINDYATTVTYIASYKQDIDDSNGFVLLTVSDIRKKLQEIRKIIVSNAKTDLDLTVE